MTLGPVSSLGLIHDFSDNSRFTRFVANICFCLDFFAIFLKPFLVAFP